MAMTYLFRSSDGCKRISLVYEGFEEMEIVSLEDLCSGIWKACWKTKNTENETGIHNI